MTIWRRINDSGGEVNVAVDGWVKIKNIFRRINDSGGEVNVSDRGWVKIKSIWRLQSTGLWYKIFGSDIPNAETANPPSLVFVSPAGLQTIDSPFNGDRMYLERGEWNEEPTKFTMYIQESVSPYTSWVNLITPVVKEYDEYSDSDSSYRVPTLTSNRPLISKADVANKVKYRGKIKAENSNGEADLNFPPFGIAPRYLFNIQSFEIEDQTETSVTLSWVYDPSTITISDIPTYMYSQKIQLYNSAGQPQLNPVRLVSLLQTSAVVNLPSTLDRDDTYEWELSIIADDYYRDFTGTRYTSSGPTEEIALIDWEPSVVQDPIITFSNRTRESFSVDWFATNATSYRVDVKRNSTGLSLPGYPTNTSNTSATLTGLADNALYSVSVRASDSSYFPAKLSNTITKSIRVLTLGQQAILSKAYNATANSFKIDILNYEDISTFDIIINCSNGNATRSGSVITVLNFTQNEPSCVSVTTSKINNVDLTAVSYDIETSTESCETAGTWYCVIYYQSTPVTCSTFESPTNVSGNGSGYAQACYTTPSCCQSTVYTDWSACSAQGKSTRTKTENLLDCTTVVTTEEKNCFFCTQSVNFNCAGCIQTLEQENISGSGSGYSIECSSTSYPACGTPCICDTTEENKCSAWSDWSSCSGGVRTRTRTCPAGSPCIKLETQTCWYCTQSVNFNCAGCTYTIEGSNISGSGSGYSITCTTSTTYPACGTPCVCDSTQESSCGAWSAWSSCSGGVRTRTRTCPGGSPCSTSQTETCWYCTTSANVNCAGCSYAIQGSNQSQSGSGFSISCSTSGYPACGTPCVCDSTQESSCGAWSAWSSCSGGVRTRTRTCPSGSPCVTSQTQQCWYCTLSVSSNCAGCSYTIEGANNSQSGSGYSISCSTSGYPGCSTPCVCDSTADGQCGAWSAWSSCSGGFRSRTRTCPSGSPCVTSQTQQCWYCTLSVSSNCAGCSYTIEGANNSQSGSGYSISCSTSGYPGCSTPCVCDSTADSQCGAWGAWGACSGGFRSRTRTCPGGSPCATSQTEACASWFCTLTPNTNCGSCSNSTETSNISGSGSGYSISCSTSGYPACQVACVCNQAEFDRCGSWSAYGTCVGGSQTRTRTCPSGSPCVTSQSRTCTTPVTWFCTTSVQGQCGCSRTTSSTNQTGSGSGFSTACSTSGYPSCPRPC